MKTKDWDFIAICVGLFAIGQVIGFWGAVVVAVAVTLFIRVAFG